MTSDVMNANWTRERLFNYDVKLHEIFKEYRYAIAKKDRDQIKTKLDLLQDEIQSDPFFARKELSLRSYLNQKKLDLDALIIELFQYMGKCWDYLTVRS